MQQCAHIPLGLDEGDYFTMFSTYLFVIFLSALKLVEFELWLTSFFFPLLFFIAHYSMLVCPFCNETHTNN